MVFKNFVSSFVRQWNFVRSETMDLLNSLNDEQLKFTPLGSPKWQPLYYQFACIGRTQMVYAKALREGEMDFQVVWPGFKQSLPNHIVSLISHERIHHGELISYFTLASLDLPENFKQNWAL